MPKPPALHIVTTTATPSPAERAATLQAQALAAADQHIADVLEFAHELAFNLDLVSKGGDVYPVGVRDLCRRMSRTLVLDTQTIQSLMERNGR